MQRWAILYLGLFLVRPALRADADIRRFSVIEIKPAKTSIYIGTVSLSLQPFVRHEGTYLSSYNARVFPFFFANESGRITIPVPDEMLRKAARGETVNFVGKGLSEDGDERRIEGLATPAGPADGKMRVRVFVSKRIAFTFNTTYHLRSAPTAQVQ
jgi:hypothetical protein